jgi:iron complex outermembrane receptor protein
MLAYAKYARGYRAGGVFSNAPVDHRTFDPEKVDSYEAGIKTSFAEPIHGLFNVSAFYNNFSHQQLQLGFNARVTNGIPAPVSPTTAIINAGKSRIYGMEVELEVRPFDGLTLDANYTYLNTRIQSISAFTTSDPNYQPGTAAITAGAPLALSPKNKATIEADYVLPLPETLGRVSVGATFTHTDKQLSNYNYLDPTVVALLGQNFSYLPSTDLLNLNVGWSSIAQSPVDVNFFVTNVADRHYYNFIPGLGSEALGLETATLGEPRMFGARVRWHFGK